MQIFSDIINFIKTLSFVDIVFFFAVLALMLLIITLIYFLRENNDSDIEVNKSSDKKELSSDEAALLSLKELTEALENAEPKEVNLNRYEEEQEEKAIIIYQELLNRKNYFAINYSEEENIAEDLTVKKVDLNNLVNKEISLKPEIKVSVISYEKEEAFLAALKELQHLLN